MRWLRLYLSCKSLKRMRYGTDPDYTYTNKTEELLSVVCLSRVRISFPFSGVAYVVFKTIL